MENEVNYKIRLTKPVDGVYDTTHQTGKELEINSKGPDGWYIIAGHGMGFTVPYDKADLVEYTTTTVSKVVPNSNFSL